METNSQSTLNISPDPNILIVLSATPLKPIDALCELIDNALDSFDAARRSGLRIDSRWIRISIPTTRQIENGEGVLRVVDNGIGLDRAGLQGALQAGFSTKNKFGALGLFGVGFNIATAKLGQRTVVTTARANSAGIVEGDALRATIDLPELKQAGNFNIPLEIVPQIERGTIVEISGWWPNGTPNERFTYELARISRSKLIEQLGRRYGTILRDPERRINMTVNEESVIPFEHCVWGENRSVTRQGVGQIPAVITFDHVLRSSRRCQDDGNILEQSERICSACHGSNIVQIEERVKGWFGVQRFDDKSNFGIDLIRNGRAIRVAEKDAFFNFTDDLGETEKEYPIDQNTGRIVGEVHLDHVPVDYTKQDFERPSREWQEAISFLRGGGLQAKNRPTGEKNTTPMGRIFDGYRRVKRYGKEDMYMGTWSETKPERISREVEVAYYKKFKAREPGYYDDGEWWKLVESATLPPVAPLRRCGSCGAENPENQAECVGCGEILIGKDCVACGQKILRSASSCLVCGADQTIIVTGPWRCLGCENLNHLDDDDCDQCGLAKGAPNPMSVDELVAVSTKSDSLSIDNLRIELINGKLTEAVSISVFLSPKDRLKPFYNQPAIPTFLPSATSFDHLQIFIDRQHSFFTELGYLPEYAVATQIAYFLLTLVGQSNNGMSVVNVSQRVIEAAYGDRVSLTKESVRREVEELIDSIVTAIAQFPWSRDLVGEMNPQEKERLVERLQQSGQLSSLDEFQNSGEFLKYVPSVLARSYRIDSDNWHGSVFRNESEEIINFAPAIGRRSAELTRNSLLRALEECAEFLDFPNPDEQTLRRVKLASKFLDGRLV